MACVMKALMEMGDVIVSMVGKDSFATPVSIIIKYEHIKLCQVLSPFVIWAGLFKANPR